MNALALCMVAALAGLLPPVLPAVPPTPCYPPPLNAVVIDPFRAPACAQCAGNRGLEYATAQATAVSAVAPGTVSFSGSVAGTVYVVVSQDDGFRATYGRLSVAVVTGGERVASGTVVGRTTQQFYFGVRFGQVYVDPAPLLGVVHYRARLVPIDGEARRPAPAASLSCGFPRQRLSDDPATPVQSPPDLHFAGPSH